MLATPLLKCATSIATPMPASSLPSPAPPLPSPAVAIPSPAVANAWAKGTSKTGSTILEKPCPKSPTKAGPKTAQESS